MLARLTLILIFSTSVFATSVCPVAQLVEPVLRDHFHDREVYSPFLCLYNAGELARILQTKLHRQIEPGRLRILIFRHRDLRALDMPSYEVDERHWVVAKNARQGDSKVFKFHAVVEYDGQILDLDNGRAATVTPFAEYMREMFPRIQFAEAGQRSIIPGHSYNEPETMGVMAIPATEYLARFKQRPGMGDGALAWANGFPVIPLGEFTSPPR